MQVPGPRASSLGTMYTAAQVTALLSQPVLVESCAFERVTLAGSAGEFTSFVSLAGASVSHDTTQQVPRTLTVNVRQDAGLDWYNDYVRVWKRYKTADSGWLEVLIGTFVPVRPTRAIDDSQVWRQLTMADPVQLANDLVLDVGVGVPAGTDLVATIRQLLTLYIPWARCYALPTAARPPQAMTWNTGTSLLTIINGMLHAIAYMPLWADEAGAFRVQPYVDFAQQTPDALFDLTQTTTSQAELAPGAALMETIDTTQGFNVVTFTGQDPRQAPIVVQYVNLSALDPMSAINFRTKLEYISDSAISDPTSALAAARFETQVRSRMHRPWQVSTVSWPWSQHYDVYSVAMNDVDDGLTVAPFLETAWTMDLAPGGLTQHTLQRLYVL